MSIPNEKTSQAKSDDKRRAQHFQVRLDTGLAAQLQHYADQRHNGVINAALSTIVSKFFNGK
jgi:ribosomal protein L32